MAKRGKMRFPRPVSELLDEGLKGLGIAERLREAEIWGIWSEVVGPAVANRAQPLRIIGGTLTVAVSSGPWMQELSFLKEMMKQKLNDKLGHPVVKEIVLRSGKVAKLAGAPEDVPPERRKLSSRELKEIEEQAVMIVDEETRSAFIQLMKTSLELKKKGEDC